MKNTFNALMNADPKIVEYYASAKRRWSKILGETELEDTAAISNAAHIHQIQFEAECGGQRLGQEIMVISSVARFYDPADGFGDDRKFAVRMLDALDRSYCSVEVKANAERVRQLYNLGDD